MDIRLPLLLFDLISARQIQNYCIGNKSFGVYIFAFFVELIFS
jgi:hypothetical protein